jgi:hypothetical protein
LTWSETYIQIAGIMAGMLTLGYRGDQIGRKWGSVTTAVIMLIGGIMLTGADGTTVKVCTATSSLLVPHAFVCSNGK